MLTEPVKSATSLVSSEEARTASDHGALPKGSTPSGETPELTYARLRELAENVQKGLKMIHNVDLQFAVHKASGEIMVTVRDASTGRVIREIPPAEILDLAAKLDEMIGLLFDQKG